MTSDTTVFGEKLNARSFIKISGVDRVEFLQGLISNDVEKLKKQPLLYSWFLTPQGKYLYDFFIFKEEGALILDCDARQATSFFKRLRLYKLRSKITIELLEGQSVLTLWGNSEEGYKDPRHDDMGRRAYQIEGIFFEESSYKVHRYALGLAEGEEEILSGKSTLLEYAMDDFNAVDFDKGCYMGQELTARVHYRGLLKKQVRPFTYESDKALVVTEKIMNEKGKNSGEIRAIDLKTKTGLALISLSALEEESQLFCQDDIELTFT